MDRTLYKVRDNVTGKYWNGCYQRSTFNDTGITWTKAAGCEETVGHFLRYRSAWGPATGDSIPASWEIVEIELVEREKTTHQMSSFVKYVLLKAEIDRIDSGLGVFAEKMHKKNLLDKIEFLFKLKPKEGDGNYVRMDRIIEARAHMRQLGVKTGTFKESQGVFGMLDRTQALKARLVLDTTHVVDLGALRKKLGI
jgi:hypothetical protein